MRCAVVQTQPRLGRVTENREELLDLLRTVPADLYVTPELATSGYNFSNRGEVSAAAETLAGPTTAALVTLCRSQKCWIVNGFVEKDGSRFYNAAALLGPEGPVGVYRKIHLFGREKLFFSPGEGPFPVFDLPYGRVGLMICFDWFFPESARCLALSGAELIAHPSNLVLPHAPQAMITRCLENRVFAATANRVGTEPGGTGPLTFIGSSQVVSPRGELLARRGLDIGVSVVEVDLTQARDKTLSSSNDLFGDRRPANYGKIVQQP